MINAIADLYIIRYNKNTGKYEFLINDNKIINFQIIDSYPLEVQFTNILSSVIDIDINFLNYRLIDASVLESNLRLSYIMLINFYTKILEPNTFINIEKIINENNRIIIEKIKSII